MLMTGPGQPILAPPLIVPLRSGFMVLVNCGTCQERMAGKLASRDVYQTFSQRCLFPLKPLTDWTAMIYFTSFSIYAKDLSA